MVHRKSGFMNGSKCAAYLLVLSVMLSAQGDATGGPPEITAQFRVRTEADLHRGFPATSASDDTVNTRSFMRTRLNFDFQKNSTTRLFIQLQDSRVYGSITGTSGGLANDLNLGLHQAYLEFRQWIWHRLEGKIGRQELNYGNQRLIGAVGWHNVGRSLDGGKLALNFRDGRVKLEAGVYTMVERDSLAPPIQGRDQDNTLATLGLFFPKSNVELLLIADVDRTRPTSATRKLERGTIALYSARSFGSNFDYITNLALQGGTAHISGQEVDIEAYLVALELGATVPGHAKARFALGLDLTSGDDGTDTTKAKEFNNLYYTGHKFRGFMDNFLGPAGTAATRGPGLADLYARAHFNIYSKWRVGIDAHLFRTAENYFSRADSSATKKVGSEIDSWIKLSDHNGVTFVYGLSLFLADDHFVGPGNETTQLWMYSQILVNMK